MARRQQALRTLVEDVALPSIRACYSGLPTAGALPAARSQEAGPSYVTVVTNGRIGAGAGEPAAPGRVFAETVYGGDSHALDAGTGRLSLEPSRDVGLCVDGE